MVYDIIIFSTFSEFRPKMKFSTTYINVISFLKCDSQILDYYFKIMDFMYLRVLRSDNLIQGKLYVIMYQSNFDFLN